MTGEEEKKGEGGGVIACHDFFVALVGAFSRCQTGSLLEQYRYTVQVLANRQTTGSRMVRACLMLETSS